MERDETNQRDIDAMSAIETMIYEGSPVNFKDGQKSNLERRDFYGFPTENAHKDWQDHIENQPSSD